MLLQFFKMITDQLSRQPIRLAAGLELRRFFTEGMLNEDGEEVSTRIIKLKIKKLIEEEDSHNPITDDQVVKILVKDGIKLSRRTVAKYRDQMNIPGSRERRAVV